MTDIQKFIFRNPNTNEESQVRFLKYQQPTRKTCPKCNKKHLTVLENQVTGEIEQMERCRECLVSGFSFAPVLDQIVIHETENYED